MARNKKSIFIILIVIIVVCFGVWYTKADIPAVWAYAEAGVCDLTDAGLDARYVRVGGEWATVNNELLTPEEFNHSGNIQYGDPDDDAEYFTSRIRLIVPDGKTYGMMWNSIDYADRIYINGEWVQDVGRPGKTADDAVPGAMAVYYTARPQNGVIEIVQQGSGFVHKDSLFTPVMGIGPPELAAKNYTRELGMTALIMGCCLLAFLVHMIFFFILRTYRANLYFALFCLVMLLRAAVTGPKLLALMFPSLSWYALFRIEYMAMPLAALCIFLAIGSMFPRLVHRPVRIAFGCAFAFFAVFFALADTVAMTYVLPVCEVVVALAALYLCVRLFMRLAKRRSLELVIVAAGFVLLSYFTVREITYHADAAIFPTFHAGMLDFAVLVFLLFQMTATLVGTSRMLSEARREAKTARQEAALHKEKAAELQALYEQIPPGNAVLRDRLVLNTLSVKGYLDGKDMGLAPMEFALLYLFVQNEGRYITSEELYRQVWNEPPGSAGAVKNLVYRLRQKIAGSGYTIASHRGKGYLFEKTTE